MQQCIPKHCKSSATDYKINSTIQQVRKQVMGTNYYMIDDSDYCEHCGRGKKEIHLGKSSVGWCFYLHVYLDKNINNLDDLVKMIGDKQIIDEYGKIFSIEEFLSIVKDRSSNTDFNTGKPYGFSSWAEFHDQNYSMPGPRGLLRFKIDGHCIGHGEGTWDYIIGDFS
jgi:hypothetical protein